MYFQSSYTHRIRNLFHVLIHRLWRSPHTYVYINALQIYIINVQYIGSPCVTINDALISQRAYTLWFSIGVSEINYLHKGSTQRSIPIRECISWRTRINLKADSASSFHPNRLCSSKQSTQEHTVSINVWVHT